MNLSGWFTVVKKKLMSTFRSLWLYRFLNLIILNQFYLKPLLKKQLQSKNKTSLEANIKPVIFIPLIETNHYQYYQVLLIAKALKLRGAKVKVLLCGSRLDGCEIKSIRSSKVDPCLTCRINQKMLLPEFGLEIAVIDDFISKDEIDSIRVVSERISRNYPRKYLYDDIDIIPIVNDSVIRYYYGALPDELSPDLSEVRKRYLISAIIAIHVSKNIYFQWKPDILFNNMNVYCDWALYFRFFQNKGVQVNTVSITPSNYFAVVLNHFELFGNNKRYESWKKSRKFRFLCSDEEKSLDQFMNLRRAGEAKVFETYGFFDGKSEIKNILNINKKKRNLFLFSNVFWDIGLSERSQLYLSVIEWVIATVDIIKDQSDCHLYIKIHPAEVMGTPSSKGVADYIYEKYPELPLNVTIIPPSLKINTYDLFSYIDLGIVYTGTLGIEMLLSGIPVVACGKGPYFGLGLVSEPKTELSYRDMLIKQHGLIESDLKEARLFAYFYFIKTFIPWNLTKQSFANDFKGFIMDSLDDILPGKNKYLDHICSCILQPECTIIENWE